MTRLLVYILLYILSLLTVVNVFQLHPILMFLLSVVGFFVYFGLATLLFIVILMLLSFPANKKKQNSYNKYYRFLLTNASRFVLMMFGVKINFVGEELLPNGNFVLVSNHRSNIDSMIFDVCLRKYPLVFIAKQSLFKIPAVGKMISGTGYLKLNRSSLKDGLKVINNGIKFLEEGKVSVGVFPEGTRGKNQHLLDFNNGCFNLAKKSKKPIVVCCLWDSSSVNDGLFYKTHRIQCHVVEVIQYENYANKSTQEIGELVNQIITSKLVELQGNEKVSLV